MREFLLSLLVGFFSSLVVAPLIIRWFARIKNGQPILHYVESHATKSGTPTMGGVIFLFGTLVSYLVFLNDNVRLATLCVAIMFAYALLGFLDDFIKVKLKNNLGLKAYQKAIGQLGIAILMAVFVYNSSFVGAEVFLPFVGGSVNFEWWIIPFVIFVYLAITNSVNLIDGLDGLACGVSFAYLLSFNIALFLHIKDLEYMGANALMINEMYSVLTLSGGVMGAILAFLCFNSNVAKIFMGDTGSLALGGFITTLAVVTKLYLYVPFFGIMFVLTALSVMLQVIYYKFTKKRIFLMAPLHHHFEKKGSNESKIVAIYIIITLVVGAGVLAFM